jgi:hypothetical protein
MAAIIEEIIQEQNFERITRNIGTILNDEIQNQITLQSLTDSVEVTVELMRLYDKSEDVRINVSVNTIDFSDTTEKDAIGKATFYIDCYVTASESELITGDESSRSKLQRYLGMSRYILQTTKHQRLGFGRGVINTITVTNMQFEDTYGQQDAAYGRMGRLTVDIRYNENQDLWLPIPLQGTSTRIQLEGSNRNYNLELEN